MSDAANGDPFGLRSEDRGLFDEVVAASNRLHGTAVRTPLVTSRQLDSMTGAQVYLKAEMYQRAGSFKFRGAYNRLAKTSQAGRGVVAHSSGNFAQAVALAAQLLGFRATVVMPDDAPPIKVAAVRSYGADIVTCGRDSSERAELAQRLSFEHGWTLVEPYDDEDVIAGQGTATLEIVEDVPSIDAIVVPLGGGGLLSGAAIAAKGLNPAIRVIGVEPAAMPKYALSMAAGEPVAVPTSSTILDGQMITRPGKVTWPIISRLVDDVVTVEDFEALEAMKLLHERLKIVAEPSGASALAAILGGKVSGFGSVAVILSGGNVGVEQMLRLFAPRCA